MTSLLLGIDCGQSATKVVLLGEEGRQVSDAARRATEVLSPRRAWAERDPLLLWRQVADGIAEVLADAGCSGAEVAAVGVCGHSDGAYLVDAAHRPVRDAVLATDTRAREVSGRLGRGDTAERMLAVTGQVPFPGSTGVVLAWLAEHEPDTVAGSRWSLGCKDWVRLCLTGVAATDRSEASTSFTDVHTQEWSAEALDLFDLPDLADLLPPIHDSTEIVGEVTTAAAALTGLRAGTPVVAGAHDVDAAAIGIGAATCGDTSAVLGTFSINQVRADRPVLDPRWQARSFVRRGQWMHIASSAAGTANLDWTLRMLGAQPGTAAARALVAAALSGPAAPDDPLFLPFLGGAPYGADLAGAFVGLRSWHDRTSLVHAVVEGIAFNHRTHLDALRDGFGERGPIRLCGGGTRSPAWTQLMADVLEVPIEVFDTGEAGARGAAVLAGSGIGLYDSLDRAVTATARISRRRFPRRETAAVRARRFERYSVAVQALAELGGVESSNVVYDRPGKRVPPT